jgi:hypothetical protein
MLQINPSQSAARGTHQQGGPIPEKEPESSVRSFVCLALPPTKHKQEMVQVQHRLSRGPLPATPDGYAQIATVLRYDILETDSFHSAAQSDRSGLSLLQRDPAVGRKCLGMVCLRDEPSLQSSFINRLPLIHTYCNRCETAHHAVVRYLRIIKAVRREGLGCRRPGLYQTKSRFELLVTRKIEGPEKGKIHRE